jgi:hypothetical protein
VTCCLKQPLLPLDVSFQQQPVLPLEIFCPIAASVFGVSVLRQSACAALDVFVQQQPKLPLDNVDMSVLDQPHLL